ncbi:hypothetical protein BYT27DRAFT_7217383 [Phlegmacium glaucopus]|nr:hypothetical protein BYT27DRAFT_7217383 [Phlegmacium glaucopus]
MAPEKIPDFSGTREDEVQPSNFLKTYPQKTRGLYTGDTEWIEGILDYLKSDSPAKEWFNDAGTPKTKWTDFNKGFTIKFPDIERVKKTRDDLERELEGMKLKVESLGQTEKIAGDDVWTHIAFAEKVLDLAKQAKINQSSSGIWKVCDNLPDALKEKITSTYKDWTSFCDAIKSLDLSVVRDAAKKHAAEQEKQSQIEVKVTVKIMATISENMSRPARLAQATVNSPTAPLHTQMTGFRITQPQTQLQNPSTPASNLFTNSGGGRGNLFGTNTTPHHRVPMSENEIATIRTAIAKYPIQPNTPEGIHAYQAQLIRWRTTNSDNAEITKITGFPLQPGGAPPGSSECFGCGYTGHNEANCTSDTNS